jgi:hypothetical protein
MESSFFGLNFEYKFKDKDLIHGIYPLKKNIQDYSKKIEILGGEKIDIEGNRFHGLGIPIGLYLSTNNIHNNEIKSKNNNQDVISNALFDKLFNNIVKKK